MRLIGFYDYTVILTYISLFSAVTGTVLASMEHFTAAVIYLMISGTCDAFDGTVARSKKNRTDDEKAFGIQIDSLCDLVSFGVFPAMLCYFMGADGVLGITLACLYCLCAVIRLAFFNVLEEKRQKVEDGCNKYYRGLPVTSISMLFPVVYLFRPIVGETAFVYVLYVMLFAVAFMFVLDVQVKKFDVSKLLHHK